MVLSCVVLDPYRKRTGTASGFYEGDEFEADVAEFLSIPLDDLGVRKGQIGVVPVIIYYDMTKDEIKSEPRSIAWISGQDICFVRGRALVFGYDETKPRSLSRLGERTVMMDAPKGFCCKFAPCLLNVKNKGCYLG